MQSKVRERKARERTLQTHVLGCYVGDEMRCKVR